MREGRSRKGGRGVGQGTNRLSLTSAQVRFLIRHVAAFLSNNRGVAGGEEGLLGGCEACYHKE